MLVNAEKGSMEIINLINDGTSRVRVNVTKFDVPKGNFSEKDSTNKKNVMFRKENVQKNQSPHPAELDINLTYSNRPNLTSLTLRGYP